MSGTPNWKIFYRNRPGGAREVYSVMTIFIGNMRMTEGYLEDEPVENLSKLKNILLEDIRHKGIQKGNEDVAMLHEECLKAMKSNRDDGVLIFIRKHGE